MFDKLMTLFSAEQRNKEVTAYLDSLRHKLPVPVFWLFGKTQSGKTSVVKFLTGADQAQIGEGFQPCTRFSRQYEFPSPETPLLTFLDTRGLEEVNYDPAEDLAKFNPIAHVVIVTVKVLDHAQEKVLTNLRQLRDAQRNRPVVLALTCLHEAYPQQQHPDVYPFDKPNWRELVPENLARSIDEQKRRFEGLVDSVVPIDLTVPEEGYKEPNYGGDAFKKALLEQLPAAYRQTLINLNEATAGLQDLSAQQALPYIISYSSLAATAGAIPIPWLDLLVLPALQTRMMYHLAELYGQPLTRARFVEIVTTLGISLTMRQATRELVKFIPYVGTVVGSALAGASTFALGKAFCYYYSAVHKGHVPQAEDLRRYYQEQLTLAEQLMQSNGKPAEVGESTK